MVKLTDIMIRLENRAVELEALRTEREAYIVENKEREVMGDAPAYGMLHFNELAERMRALEVEQCFLDAEEVDLVLGDQAEWLETFHVNVEDHEECMEDYFFRKCPADHFAGCDIEEVFARQKLVSKILSQFTPVKRRKDE